MKRNVQLSWLASVLLLIQPSVHADERAVYFGGSAGTAFYDNVEVEFEERLPSVNWDIDDREFAWKGFVGVSLHEYFAIEFSYRDVNDFSVNGELSEVGYSNSGALSFDAFTFSGLFRWPVQEDFSVFAILGGARWEAKGHSTQKLDSNEIDDVIEVTNAVKDDGIDFLAGIGAEYEFGNELGVRFDAERLFIEGEDLMMLSVGLEYDLPF
ncbi:MAG: outer membrane beta-barrel protein [Candidatus Eutrophobiaceae bacterium]